MRCVVCEAETPEGAAECTHCREPFGPWLQLNAAATQLLQEGVQLAASGESLRAALSLTKASCLKPEDPVTLKVFGQFLARHGIYDQAAYYLKAAEQLAPNDEETTAALSRIETLLGDPKAPVAQRGSEGSAT